MKKYLVHIAYIAIIVLLALQVYSAKIRVATSERSGGSADVTGEDTAEERIGDSADVARLYKELATGFEYELKGMTTKASENYLSAIRINENHSLGIPEVYLHLARARFKARKFKLAEEPIQEYLTKTASVKGTEKNGGDSTDSERERRGEAERLLKQIKEERSKGWITQGESNILFNDTCSFGSNGEFFFVDGIVVLSPGAKIPVGTTLCVNGSEARVTGHRPVWRYAGLEETYPVLDSRFPFTYAIIGNCTDGTTFNEISSMSKLPDNIRAKVEQAAETSFMTNISGYFNNGYIPSDKGFRGLNNYIRELIRGERQPEISISINAYESNGYAYGFIRADYNDTMNFEPGDYRGSGIPDGKVSRKVLLAAGFGTFSYVREESGNYKLRNINLNRFEHAWELEVQNRLGEDISYNRNIDKLSDLDGDGNPELYYTTWHYESNGGYLEELALKDGSTTSLASFGCGY
jgi:hypothetical protein